MCTSSLVDEDVNFCDLIGTEGDDNYYCAPAGTYSFEEEFEIPEASLSNFAVNGVTFRTYVELNGEFTCHAQWKTVKISNAYSMLGIVFVVVSAVSLVFVQQRRRLRTKRAQKMNLQEEEQRADAANTVEIDFSGNSNRSHNHKHHRENHVTMEMDHYVSL